METIILERPMAGAEITDGIVASPEDAAPAQATLEVSTEVAEQSAPELATETSQERAIRLSQLPILGKYVAVEQKVYTTGARHVYGVGIVGYKKNGEAIKKRRHLSYDAVLQGYLEPEQLAAHKSGLAANRALKPDQVTVPAVEDVAVRRFRQALEAQAKAALAPAAAQKRPSAWKRLKSRLGRAYKGTWDFHDNHPNALPAASVLAAAAVVGGLIVPTVVASDTAPEADRSVTGDGYAYCVDESYSQFDPLCKDMVEQKMTEQTEQKLHAKVNEQRWAAPAQSSQELPGSTGPADIPTLLPAFEAGDSVWSTVSAIKGLNPAQVAHQTQVELRYNHIKDPATLPVGYRLKVAPELGKLIAKLHK